MRNIFVILLILLINHGLVEYAVAQQDNVCFVFLNSNPDRGKIPEEEVQELQAAHLENIDRLAKEGTLLAAGPFEGGGGMFIITANSLDEADNILSTDPAISANRFILQIYPFRQLFGGLCPVGEEYEMTTYTFIKIDASGDQKILTEYLINNATEKLIEDTDTEVITVACFGNSGKGIVIYDGEADNDISHLFTTNVKYQSKKLWIARGTFCE